MERTIVTLAGLNAADTAALAAQGIVTGEDLSAITFADISSTMENASVVQRRKLSHIGSYLARGQVISEATTMPTIINYLNTPVVPVMNPAPPQLAPPRPPDPSRGALRLHINSIEKYSGSPIDFEDWELKTSATLGQTAYAMFLSEPPTPGDLVQLTRNRELYNMFVTAIMDGSGMHSLNGVTDQDGHGAWMAIKAWYGLAATSRTIIDHYRNKLESLKLDASAEASQYVNDFIISCQKLEDKDEGYTAETKRQKFLDQIVDEDYDVAKQQLTGDPTKTFHECVLRIRIREQDLLKEGNDSLKKARRFKKSEESESKSESNNGKIPSIPGHILYKIKPENIKKDLIRWRGIYN
jgi:hypothetical protein